MADRHLDNLARQMGYHDFATYQAYQAKQHAVRMDNGIQGTGTAQGEAVAPTNWLQNIAQHIPLHPAYLLDYVSKKFGAATGQK